MNRLEEFGLLFWCNHIFGRDQYRALVKIGPSVFDDDRHSPMVPRTQIGGGVRESGENCERCRRHGTNPGTEKSGADTGSLGERAPGRAAESIASLINQY